MSDTSSILVKHNGPYLVTNVKVLTNSKGETLESKEIMALCRCGQSKTKPFCDGSHREGFTDDKN